MKTITLLLTVLLSGCAGMLDLWKDDIKEVKDCAELASDAAEETYNACVAERLTR